MADIQKSVDVSVPVDTAYRQWTQFESWPQFMSGMQKVTRMGNNELHFVMSADGKTEEWNARITSEVMDREISWQSTSGQPNSGRVTFQPEGSDRTRVTVDLRWQPDSAIEKAGSWLGFDDRQVEQDLQNFKSLVERQGVAGGTAGYTGTAR